MQHGEITIHEAHTVIQTQKRHGILRWQMVDVFITL